jgi:hypothetical protein
MATYDPPQPMWKRNRAGILDFFLAFFVCGYGVSEIIDPMRPRLLATTRNLRLRGGIRSAGNLLGQSCRALDVRETTRLTRTEIQALTKFLPTR